MRNESKSLDVLVLHKRPISTLAERFEHEHNC